ncbi:MAG TPA: capsular biosynthesis protein [Burkholderiaceae bacterium]
MDIEPRAERSFLFLQGMASQFFACLGTALRDRGHTVNRVNFNAGDRLFWPLRGAIDFRGRAADWPDFLANILVTRKVTDIILFGDCRPLHRQAIQLAQSLQLTVHVCEEGYIRPHWVTFERDGVNGHSTLPRNPDWYREVSASLPPLEPMPNVPSSFRKRAWQDLIYNATAIAFGPFYPHYQTHRPRHRLVEYAGWSRKVARRPWIQRRVATEIQRITPQTRFFLLPLQLNCDSQILLHSQFGSMTPVISTIIESFARHAPPDTLLVVKEHPLDDGLIDWRALVMRLAEAAAVADRIIYLELGDLNRLITNTLGVVTVNSTTGTLALAAGVPVITLGTAIYDIAGLTHQDPLDTFWTNPTPPDLSLFAAFRQVLASRCLLVGSFFSEQGIKLLVQNAVDRLEATASGHAMQVAIADDPSKKHQEIAIPT